ncbi:Guanine nucleotide exchange factor H1 [Apodemus speciosus]|uniref:Guanine nucleotide exchange factor H1 n=1 Tax=Apodemus speciosus TaxID=105296 RepID=A0ABQ0EKU4_APOSI
MSRLRVPSMNSSVPGESFIGEEPVPHGHPQCCPPAVGSGEQLEEVEGTEENQDDNNNGFHTSLLRSWGPGKEFQDPMISRRRLHGQPFHRVQNPNGNSSQSLDTDLSKCGKQLEEASGTWAGSSLRRTFSFLLGMTGRDKDFLLFGNKC